MLILKKPYIKHNGKQFLAINTPGLNLEVWNLKYEDWK